MNDTAVTREALHFRRIDMHGYRRSDGLYEVEGRVTDRKPYDFVPLLGGKQVPPHEPLHDMGVKIVYDAQMKVHDIQTFTEAAPYAICPEGGRALQSLKGLTMTAGWSNEVRSRLSGARSCTHLMQLLMPLATVAFQALSVRRKNAPVELDPSGRPLKIDSCYAYGAERELVQIHWPAFYRPPSPKED